MMNVEEVFGAAIEMDAERFPDWNTSSRDSFYRVVNLFKKTGNLKATKKLKQAKIM